MGRLVSDDIKKDRVVPFDQSVKLEISYMGIPKSAEGYPRFSKSNIEISRETLKEIFGTEGTMVINNKMKYFEKKPVEQEDKSKKDQWVEIVNPIAN